MEKRIYRILSLDGGGVHGLLTAILLRRIEEQRPGFLAQADYYAGTSAGGIMALALAAAQDPGQKIEECVQFWQDLTLTHNSPFGYLAGALGLGPIWSDRPWLKAIKRLFAKGMVNSDPVLRELNKWVVIPTGRLDEKGPSSYEWRVSSDGQPTRRAWRPKIFHNFPTYFDPDDLKAGQSGPRVPWGGPTARKAWRDALEKGRNWKPSEEKVADAERRAVDVAMMTSAAPIAHRAYHGYIDGGLFANNPSLCAIEYATHNIRGWPSYFEGKEPVDVNSMSKDEKSSIWPDLLKTFLVFSVGTGGYDYYVTSRRGSLGWGHWLAHPGEPILLYLAVASLNSDMVSEQTLALLGANYWRLDPPLLPRVNMFKAADPKDIMKLMDIAMTCDLKHTLEWIDQPISWFPAGTSSVNRNPTQSAHETLRVE